MIWGCFRINQSKAFMVVYGHLASHKNHNVSNRVFIAFDYGECGCVRVWCGCWGISKVLLCACCRRWFTASLPGTRVLKTLIGCLLLWAGLPAFLFASRELSLYYHGSWSEFCRQRSPDFSTWSFWSSPVWCLCVTLRTPNTVSNRFILILFNLYIHFWRENRLRTKPTGGHDCKIVVSDLYKLQCLGYFHVWET